MLDTNMVTPDCKKFVVGHRNYRLSGLDSSNPVLNHHHLPNKVAERQSGQCPAIKLVDRLV
jgi:hypothetical protein